MRNNTGIKIGDKDLSFYFDKPISFKSEKTLRWLPDLNKEHEYKKVAKGVKLGVVNSWKVNEDNGDAFLMIENNSGYFSPTFLKGVKNGVIKPPYHNYFWVKISDDVTSDVKEQADKEFKQDETRDKEREESQKGIFDILGEDLKKILKWILILTILIIVGKIILEKSIK